MNAQWQIKDADEKVKVAGPEVHSSFRSHQLKGSSTLLPQNTLSYNLISFRKQMLHHCGMKKSDLKRDKHTEQ